MNGNITYHQQISYCGKPRCRKCRDGIGHGPYWYAYHTEKGRTTRTYIGKNLPANVQAPVVVETSPSSEEPQPPQEHETAVLSIRVLGQFSLERRQGARWQPVEESAWQHQRVRSLLACLLSSPGRRLGREQIMDALWPEADLETASNRLDRGVYSLRQLLEPTLSRPSTSQLLRIEREGLILADQTAIWVDADAFEHLLTSAHTTSDPREAERLLEQAAALYGGDFLPEERRSEWTAARREILQRAWMGLLLELADLRLASTAFALAIEPLDRLLAADPTNEAAVQRLILSLAQLDRRGEALRAYQHFASALKREYNVAPLLETRHLYDAVQQGETEISIALPLQNPQRQSVEARNEQAEQTRQFYKVQIGRSHQSPLIGRDAELATMQQVLNAAEQETRASAPGRKKVTTLYAERQHRPHCIVLMGEAGIGKTRLAEELSSEAQKRGWAIAWSRVYAQESGVPYRQWTEVLRNALTQGQWQRQEISKYPLVFQPLSTLLPELHDILPGVDFPAPLTPEQEQLRLWEATLQLLTMMSERMPLLLVLDDFHWADASSAELFAYLVRRLHGRPIIFVGTYRDNELASTNPLRPLLTDLQREQAIVHLPIAPLSDEQIRSLVSHVPSLPVTLVQYIQTRAAGNPFFAEELARSLETYTATSPVPPAFSLNPADLPSVPVNGFPLPDTISAVLELRMNRLSSACSRFLGNAAVFGGSFTFQLITQLEASGSGGMSEDTLLDLIEEAIEAGVLTEEGTGTRITYHFWHPLLVSHLYDQLSAARQARLHRRAAAVLQSSSSGREAENAAMITNHLLKGGAEAASIVHYASLAADRAYALSAYPEAEQYYRIAVAQLDEQHVLPDTAEEREQLSYLLERLGECQRVQGNSTAARSAYERVLTMRTQQPDTMADSQYEAQIRAILWREISLTWYDMGDTAQARLCCEQGEHILHEASVKNGPALAILRYEQSYINWREGNYDAAQRMALEAQKLFENAPKSSSQSARIDPHITATKRIFVDEHINLGRIHVLLGLVANSTGQPKVALPHLNAALTVFEQAELQREVANTCCMIGDIYLKRAEYELAQSFFRRSLHLAQRVGDISLLAVVFGNLGEVTLHTGNLQEAEAFFKNGLNLAEKINDQFYINNLCVDLATTSQDQGKLREAGDYIHSALKAGRSVYNLPCISHALVALGNWRIVNAIQLHPTQDGASKAPPTHLLRRGRKTLERVLAIEELETETRVKAQLAISHILLLLGETETAQDVASSTIEEAQQSELIWSYFCGQRLLGSIAAALSQFEQAKDSFVQSMQGFQAAGMRLEHARTVYNYGKVLLETKDVSQGLRLLNEARQVFSDCHAALDLQGVDAVLARYTTQNVRSRG